MLHRHIALSTWISLQHSRVGACLLQPSLRLPAEPPLYLPFEQRLFTYLLKWKRVGLHFECDCHLLSHVEKQLLQLLMLWCVPYSITKKRPEDKKKAAPARTSRGPSRQLSMPAPSVLLSPPHLVEDKQMLLLDPSPCNPLQKHKPAIYYKNFPADSQHIPASRQSSHVAQPFQFPLPSLEEQKLGCAGGNRNH